MSTRDLRKPNLNDKLHSLRDEAVAVDSEIKAVSEAKSRAVKEKEKKGKKDN